MSEAGYNIEHCPFVVDETPYCLWECNLARLNLTFLESIDPYYFQHVVETFAPMLEGEAKHYAAVALRSGYSHGLETLFALLCAFVQAPQCPAGWIIKL